MIELNNVTGAHPLFTQDGGVGQKKWFNIRLYTERLSADSVVRLRVNGDDLHTPEGQVQVEVTESVPIEYTSVHALLTTGDVVTAEILGGAVNVKVGGNTDTEEL